ncbi:hypothetical protein L7F22_031962 [Adiantum nelumboides]|nr:hypothetical protein [Adiantum nelumboides]
MDIPKGTEITSNYTTFPITSYLEKGLLQTVQGRVLLVMTNPKHRIECTDEDHKDKEKDEDEKGPFEPHHSFDEDDDDDNPSSGSGLASRGARCNPPTDSSHAPKPPSSGSGLASRGARCNPPTDSSHAPKPPSLASKEFRIPWSLPIQTSAQTNSEQTLQKDVPAKTAAQETNNLEARQDDRVVANTTDDARSSSQFMAPIPEIGAIISFGHGSSIPEIEEPWPNELWETIRNRKDASATLHSAPNLEIDLDNEFYPGDIESLYGDAGKEVSMESKLKSLKTLPSFIGDQEARSEAMMEHETPIPSLETKPKSFGFEMPKAKVVETSAQTNSEQTLKKDVPAKTVAQETNNLEARQDDSVVANTTDDERSRSQFMAPIPEIEESWPNELWKTIRNRKDASVTLQSAPILKIDLEISRRYPVIVW